MAKLYFRYGTVSSAKSLNLLAVAHNYESQHKKVLLMKPKIDDRFGESEVRSRAGLSKLAHLLVDHRSHIEFDFTLLKDVACVLVDECQFLPESFVELLRNITIDFNIPVICYGLRTDFKSRSFAGSQRLLELADVIEEVKTICYFCNQKAVFNLKHVNGNPIYEGESVDLGAEEKYLPACYSHFRKPEL